MSETHTNSVLDEDQCRRRKLLAIKRRLLEREMMEYLNTASRDLDQSNHDYEEVCFDPSKVEPEKSKLTGSFDRVAVDMLTGASSHQNDIRSPKQRLSGLKKRSNSDSDLFLVDESREIELCCSSVASIADAVARNLPVGCDDGEHEELEQGFYRVYDDLDRIREWNLIPYVIARKHREAAMLEQGGTAASKTHPDKCKMDEHPTEMAITTTTTITNHKQLEGEAPATTGRMCCPPGLRSDSSRVSLDSGRASVVSSNLSSYVTVRSKRLYSDSGSSCSADSGTYHLFDNNGNAPVTCVSSPQKSGHEKALSAAKGGHEHHKSEEFLRQVSHQLSFISQDVQSMRNARLVRGSEASLKLSSAIANLPGYQPSGAKPKKKQPRPEAYPPVPPPPPLHLRPPPKNLQPLAQASAALIPKSPPPLPPRLKCTKTGTAPFSSSSAASAQHQTQPPHLSHHLVRPRYSSTQITTTTTTTATTQRKDLSDYFGLAQDEETRVSKEVVKKVAIQNLSADVRASMIRTSSNGESSSSAASPPGKKDLNKYLGIQPTTRVAPSSSPSSCSSALNSTSSSPSASSLLKRLKPSSPQALHCLQKGQRGELPPPPFILKSSVRPQPPPSVASAVDAAYTHMPTSKIDGNGKPVSCRRVLDFSAECCASDQGKEVDNFVAQTPSLPLSLATPAPGTDAKTTPDISPPKVKPVSSNLRSSAMARLFFRNPLRMGATNRRRSIQEGEMGKKDEVLTHPYIANTPKIRKNSSIRRRRSFKSASASKAGPNPRKSFMASLLASATGTDSDCGMASKRTPRRRRAPMLAPNSPSSKARGLKLEHPCSSAAQNRAAKAAKPHESDERIEIDDDGALNEMESHQEDGEESFASLWRKRDLNPRQLFTANHPVPQVGGCQNDVGLPVMPFVHPTQNLGLANLVVKRNPLNTVPKPPLPVKARHNHQDNGTCQQEPKLEQQEISCCKNSNHNRAAQSVPPPQQQRRGEQEDASITKLRVNAQMESHLFAINDRTGPQSRMSMLREVGVLDDDDKENELPITGDGQGVWGPALISSLSMESVFKCPTNLPRQHSSDHQGSSRQPKRQLSSLYLSMSGGASGHSSRAFEALATPARHYPKDASKTWWTLPHPKSMPFAVDIDIDEQQNGCQDNLEGPQKLVQHCQSCTCGAPRTQAGNSNAGESHKVHQAPPAKSSEDRSLELDYVPMEQQGNRGCHWSSEGQEGPITPTLRRRSCSLVAFSSPKSNPSLADGGSNF